MPNNYVSKNNYENYINSNNNKVNVEIPGLINSAKEELSERLDNLNTLTESVKTFVNEEIKTKIE